MPGNPAGPAHRPKALPHPEENRQQVRGDRCSMDRRKAAGASGSSHDAMLPRSTLEELTGHELQADRREIAGRSSPTGGARGDPAADRKRKTSSASAAGRLCVEILNNAKAGLDDTSSRWNASSTREILAGAWQRSPVPSRDPVAWYRDAFRPWRTSSSASSDRGEKALQSRDHRRAFDLSSPSSCSSR